MAQTSGQYYADLLRRMGRGYMGFMDRQAGVALKPRPNISLDQVPDIAPPAPPAPASAPPPAGPPLTPAPPASAPPAPVQGPQGGVPAGGGMAPGTQPPMGPPKELMGQGPEGGPIDPAMLEMAIGLSGKDDEMALASERLARVQALRDRNQGPLGIQGQGIYTAGSPLAYIAQALENKRNRQREGELDSSRDQILREQVEGRQGVGNRLMEILGALRNKAPEQTKTLPGYTGTIRV